MVRHERSTSAGLLLAAVLVFGPPEPVLACDAPGVSCSSEEMPPAALAPDAGDRCEVGSVAPAVRARPRPAFVPLNPNGHNQRDQPAGSLAEILRQIERERAQVRSQR